MTDQTALLGTRNAMASVVTVRSMASERRFSSAAGALSAATFGRSAAGTEGSALCRSSRSGSVAGASDPRVRQRRR